MCTGANSSARARRFEVLNDSSVDRTQTADIVSQVLLRSLISTVESVKRPGETALGAALKFQLAEVDFEKCVSGRRVNGQFDDGADFILRNTAPSGDGCRWFWGEDIF